MAKSGNLWAVAYEDEQQANRVREEIVRLGWNRNYLVLEDVAVVVRHADGSFTMDREAFPVLSNLVGTSAVGFLAGLVLGGPLVGAAVGAVVGSVGSALVSESVGIGDDFVAEVKGLMKPGTSVIFVLDYEGQMEVILHAIRGLGGAVLKTNVDLEHARLIQSTLAAPSEQTDKAAGK